jgi:hypothetical protein
MTIPKLVYKLLGETDTDMLIPQSFVVKPASHRKGPDSISVRVGFIVDKVAMGVV